MSLKDEIESNAKSTFEEVWTTRDGQKVPDSDGVGLGNVGVRLDGTVLYADLSDSTGLVTRKSAEFAAEIYKTYLYAAAKIIRAHGGVITAYDGDRIMAVFIGDLKNTTAAKCALQIQWAVSNILRPAMKKIYPNSSYKIQQKVGIDSSTLVAAKTGIRGSNDLVWVGAAANNAAKMAALDAGYTTYISAATYSMLYKTSKFSDGKNMWTDLGTESFGYRIYGSTWTWALR